MGSKRMQFRRATLFLFGLLWLAGVAANPPLPAQGLLFELTRAGSHAGYLFGTIHSEDPRVLELPAPVSDAFDRSENFVMEMEFDASSLLYSVTSLVLNDKRTLKDILGEQLYGETVQAMQKIGIPESATRKFKVWAVVTILSLPPPETGLFMDMVLYNRAQQQGKRVRGLETAEEQLAIFENMSEADQIAMLRDTLKAYSSLPILYERLLDAYLKRDLEQLMALNEEYMQSGDPGAAQRFQVRVLDERNLRMVNRVLPILDQGQAFIAVGALHLPGDKGLVNLLRERGFGVESIY